MIRRPRPSSGRFVAPRCRPPAPRRPISDRQRADANRLIDAALKDSTAYTRLGDLTDRFGNRLSGSKALEDAINWILDKMKADGFANVRGEPAMVPHWVRGDESATLVSPRTAPLHMLGLGMSVGTPDGGITAPVLVVNSFDELQRHAARGERQDRAVRRSVSDRTSRRWSDTEPRWRIAAARRPRRRRSARWRR